MHQVLNHAAVLAAIVLNASCATTEARRPVPDRSRSFIGPVVSAAELSRFGRHDTVLGALRRLRPNFLWSRGSAVVGVSIDGAAVVDLSVLATIQVSAIEDVRLERASTSARFARVTFSGDIVVGDVLIVRTRMGLR